MIVIYLEVFLFIYNDRCLCIMMGGAGCWWVFAGILGVSFSRTGNAWLAYIKNRTTKTQINKYFRVSVYGWRGAKRKAIEARLDLEEEMKAHHAGHWDVSPCSEWDPLIRSK